MLRERCSCKLTPLNQFDLDADPLLWGADNIMRGHREADDSIHNPDPRRDKYIDNGGTFLTSRSIANLGCLAIIALGIITLLCVVLPCFATGSSLTAV